MIENTRDTIEVGKGTPNRLSKSSNEALAWFWIIKIAAKTVWIEASPSCSAPDNKGMCLELNGSESK